MTSPKCRIGLQLKPITMNTNLNIDPQKFPGRIVSEETAALIGFKPHDIPHLVRAKLLKPLGDPNGPFVKYFARDYIIALSQDPIWLAKATAHMQAVWRRKTVARKSKKKTGPDSDSQTEIDA